MRGRSGQEARRGSLGDMGGGTGTARLSAVAFVCIRSGPVYAAVQLQGKMDGPCTAVHTASNRRGVRRRRNTLPWPTLDSQRRLAAPALTGQASPKPNNTRLLGRTTCNWRGRTTRLRAHTRAGSNTVHAAGGATRVRSAALHSRAAGPGAALDRRRSPAPGIHTPHHQLACRPPPSLGQRVPTGFGTHARTHARACP